MRVRPDDPPQWRLAFAVLDLTRERAWGPFLRLLILVALVLSGLVVLVTTGPVMTALTAALGAGAVGARRFGRSRAQ